MFRDKVTVMDAIVVVDLVDSSITFGVHSKNNIRSMPPTNEMENYETTGICLCIFRCYLVKH